MKPQEISLHAKEEREKCVSYFKATFSPSTLKHQVGVLKF